jgi:hypothetical protein
MGISAIFSTARICADWRRKTGVKNMPDLRELIELTDAIAAYDHLTDAEFERLSDRRIAAEDAYLAIGSPGAKWLGELIQAGHDLDAAKLRAVASLDASVA